MSFFDAWEDPYQNPNFSTSCDFPENYTTNHEWEDREFRLAQAIWNLPKKQRDYEILIKLKMSTRDFLLRQSRRFPWILTDLIKNGGGWDFEVGGDSILFDTKRHFLNKVYQIHGLSPEEIRNHRPCLEILQKITGLNYASPRYVLDEDPPSVEYVSPEEARVRATTDFHRAVISARIDLEFYALQMFHVVDELRKNKTKKIPSPQSSSRKLIRGNNNREVSFGPTLVYNERVGYGIDGLGFRRTPTYYAFRPVPQQRTLAPPRKLIS